MRASNVIFQTEYLNNKILSSFRPAVRRGVEAALSEIPGVTKGCYAEVVLPNKLDLRENERAVGKVVVATKRNVFAPILKALSLPPDLIKKGGKAEAFINDYSRKDGINPDYGCVNKDNIVSVAQTTAQKARQNARIVYDFASKHLFGSSESRAIKRSQRRSQKMFDSLVEWNKKEITVPEPEIK